MIITIMGLLIADPTIFDDFQIPENVSRETLVNNICIQCGEFEVLYPDPEFFKFALGVWADKNIKVWNDLYNTTNLEYNPIENYDRTEEFTVLDSGNSTSNITSSGESTTENVSERTNSSTGESTTSSTGFNSDELKTSSKNVTTGNGTENSKDNTTMNGSNTGEERQQYTGEKTTTGRIHGNIGVTTSQQMIEAERAVVKFNIYDYIINDFKQEFCILIY